MLNYMPGEQYLIVSTGGFALLDGAADLAAAVAVWKVLPHAKDFSSVLEVLVNSSGASLSALPSFVVVLVSDDGDTHVVVRGPLTVQASTVSGKSEEISGLGVTTWTERPLHAVTGLDINADVEQDNWLPLRDGIVTASAVQWHTAQYTKAHDTVEPEPGPKHAASTVPEGPASVPAPPPAEEPAAAAETKLPPAETVTSLSDEDGGGYTQLIYGETRASSVEAAAVREIEEPEPHGDRALPLPPPAPAAPLAPPVPPVAVPPAPPAPASPGPIPPPPPPPASPGVISGIPIPAAPAAAPPAPQQPGDHDGETISAAQLAQMRAAQGTPTPVGGAAATPQPHVILILPDGERVPLSGSAVLGRKPEAVRSTGGVPQLVAVKGTAQTISRSHLELRFEGGQLLATDLDTTNGTRVLRHGRDPFRLQPRTAHLLLPGDRLDLGDGVLLSFEGLQ